jgi:hypothetical protein
MNVQDAMIEALITMNMAKENAILHTVMAANVSEEAAEAAYEEVFETLTYGM